MATNAYPTSCLSAYCGNIVCDGCPSRPKLAAYYEKRGELADYEARQVESRALVLKWADEKKC